MHSLKSGASLESFFVYKPLRLPKKKKSERPIVSKRHKLLYYSVPKAACTTVKTFLYELDKTDKQDDAQFSHQIRLDSIAFDEVGEEEYKDYFSFAFVRNPWDRVVSCYFNKVKEPAKTRICNQYMLNGEYREFLRSYGHCGFRYMGFDDFVYFISQVPDRSSDIHFRSQHTFINQKHLKFLGRMERFNEDFMHVIKKVSPRYNHKELLKKKLMSSCHKHYSEYYNRETKALVEERYKEDIQRFSYEFAN